MKKLVIAAAIVCVAAMSQAASIDWKMTNGSTGDSFNKVAIYMVAGANYSAAIANLTSEGGDDWINKYAIGKTAAGTANVRGGINTSTDIGEATSVAWFVFKDGIVEGKGYQTTGVKDVKDYLYTPPASVPGTYDLGVSSSSYTTTGTIAAVPEPTSGLLLLLGVAGMALRRRRA